MGASGAVAVILIKEKEIVSAFREAGATSPASAVSTESIGVHERIAFYKLRQRAVLREAGAGLYYVDEPSWEALRGQRWRIALLLAILILTLAVAEGFRR